MTALPRAAHSGWMGLSCFGAALSAYSSCGAAAAIVTDERMRPWPCLHSQGRCGWGRAAHAWRTLRCHNALIITYHFELSSLAPKCKALELLRLNAVGGSR